MFQGLPSAQYLRQLRRRGIYAWSQLALRSVILLAVAVAILAGSARVRELCKTYGELVLGGDSSSTYRDSLAKVEPLFEGLVWMAAIPCLFVIALAALGCVMQTRGALGFSVLRRSHTQARRFYIFRFMLGFAVVTTLALASFRWCGRDLLEAVRIAEPEQLGKYYSALLLRFCKVIVVAAAVLAILLVFVSRMRFLFQLRGARRELPGQDGDVSVPRVS